MVSVGVALSFRRESVGVLTASTVVDALQGAGLTVWTDPDVFGTTPRLLVFDRCDEGLLAHVAYLSENGQHRLIAFQDSEEELGTSDAWSVLAAGASDVFHREVVPAPLEFITARLKRWAEVDRILARREQSTPIVGESAIMRRLLRQVVEMAHFSRTSILIDGQSGTGKELIARLIHETSESAVGEEIVVLDCTTIVPELSGSEFFGHERGAFTNAIAARDGAFAMASGGTLFLDEIGELPLRLQGEILRAVQEKTYKRVGGNRWRPTDFRLVCATNRDLPTAVEEGRFRADLFHRIAGWRCRLPALTERRDDIPDLVRHFLQVALRRSPPGVDPILMDLLLARPYPGNVRELKQLVGRIAARHVGPGPITLGDLPEEERPSSPSVLVDWRSGAFRHALRRAIASGVGLKEIGAVTSAEVVAIAIDEAEGNLGDAADRLGVTRRALELRRAKKAEVSGSKAAPGGSVDLGHYPGIDRLRH